MPRYNRIKAVLADKEKTNKWLAAELGKNKSTVSHWCSNDLQPTINTLFKIAEALDVEAGELLMKRKT